VFFETEEFVPSRALFTLFSAMQFSAGTPLEGQNNPRQNSGCPTKYTRADGDVTQRQEAVHPEPFRSLI
jgi:hypothetical protein